MKSISPAVAGSSGQSKAQNWSDDIIHSFHPGCAKSHQYTETKHPAGTVGGWSSLRSRHGPPVCKKIRCVPPVGSPGVCAVETGRGVRLSVRAMADGDDSASAERGAAVMGA